jgi:hypothetical protein
MLARDPVETTEQAESFLRENPLIAYYDEILFDGLRLAQADAARGLLDEERMRHVRDAVAEIVDDLKAHEDKAEAVLRDDAEQLRLAPRAPATSRSSSGAEISSRGLARGKAGTVHSGSYDVGRGNRDGGCPACRTARHWRSERAGRCFVDVANV